MGWLRGRRTAYGVDGVGAAWTEVTAEGSDRRRCGVDGGCGAGGKDSAKMEEWVGGGGGR